MPSLLPDQFQRQILDVFARQLPTQLSDQFQRQISIQQPDVFERCSGLQLPSQISDQFQLQVAQSRSKKLDDQSPLRPALQDETSITHVTAAIQPAPLLQSDLLQPDISNLYIKIPTLPVSQLDLKAKINTRLNEMTLYNFKNPDDTVLVNRHDHFFPRDEKEYKVCDSDDDPDEDEDDNDAKLLLVSWFLFCVVVALVICLLLLVICI